MALTKRVVVSTPQGNVIATQATNARATYIPPINAGAGTAARYPGPVVGPNAPNARQTVVHQTVRRGR